MPIYGVKIIGRPKRVLVRADTASKAVAHFCEAKALTAEEMQDALDEGERVWKPGAPLLEVEAEEAQDEAKGREVAPGDDKDEADTDTGA